MIHLKKKVIDFLAQMTLGIAVGFVILMIWILAGRACDACEGSAGANGDDTAVMMAIIKLQPAHSPEVAAAWAGVIDRAATKHGIDPLLVVAIAFRESSLRANVISDDGRDVGAMQLRGVARTHMPIGCNARDLACNIAGGVSYLAWCREHCGGSWAVWVGAYGMARCPTEAEARGLKSVKRAKQLYERIGGTEWR